MQMALHHKRAGIMSTNSDASDVKDFSTSSITCDVIEFYSHAIIMHPEGISQSSRSLEYLLESPNGRELVNKDRRVLYVLALAHLITKLTFGQYGSDDNGAASTETNNSSISDDKAPLLIDFTMEEWDGFLQELRSLKEKLEKIYDEREVHTEECDSALKELDCIIDGTNVHLVTSILRPHAGKTETEFYKHAEANAQKIYDCIQERLDDSNKCKQHLLTFFTLPSPDNDGTAVEIREINSFQKFFLDEDNNNLDISLRKYCKDAVSVIQKCYKTFFPTPTLVSIGYMTRSSRNRHGESDDDESVGDILEKEHTFKSVSAKSDENEEERSTSMGQRHRDRNEVASACSHHEQDETEPNNPWNDTSSSEDEKDSRTSHRHKRNVGKSTKETRDTNVTSHIEVETGMRYLKSKRKKNKRSRENDKDDSDVEDIDSFTSDSNNDENEDIGDSSVRRPALSEVPSKRRRKTIRIVIAEPEIERKPRKRRRFWTEEEDDALRKGLDKYEIGQWLEIKKMFPQVLRQRTAVQIKDRHRTMLQKGLLG